MGEQIHNLLPWGGELAERLRGFMVESGHLMFPWSPSSAPHRPSFCKRHGLDGAIISAMDFLLGIGRVARLQADRIEGATGYADTDLEAKLNAAKDALRYNDFVLIHYNAPDEESHKRDVAGKVAALERADRELLAPLVAHLEDTYPGNYRLAVLPDHYTYCETGKHGADPVEYVLYGDGIEPGRSEAVLKSYEFLDFMRG